MVLYFFLKKVARQIWLCWVCLQWEESQTPNYLIAITKRLCCPSPNEAAKIQKAWGGGGKPGVHFYTERTANSVLALDANSRV